MRFYSCGCPALLTDGSVDFGFKELKESGVSDLPCVTYVPNGAALPLYQQGKHLEYMARSLSLKNCEVLARAWERYKRNVRSPQGTTALIAVPKFRDYHFHMNRMQYHPIVNPTFKQRIRTCSFLDC